MGSAARARELLERIATRPRPAGSAAERDVQRFCAGELERLGFRTTEVPFSYSTLPGRWATPLGGAMSILALAAAGHLGFRGAPVSALAVLLAAAAILGLGGRWVARRGVLAIPAARAEGLNLAAVRGVDSPRVWLVAHTDSKSQPVSIGVRVAGIVGSALVWVAAFALVAMQLAGSAGSAAAAQGFWPWVAGAGLLAGLPVVASIVGERSPGAVDNASGVATVLMAAAAVPARLPLGVLLTSAEEFGLAGARAWAQGAEPAIALNCDGVDDVGKLTCMLSGRRRSGFADVAGALRRAAVRSGEPLRVIGTIPGILVDGVALADAGWSSATLSRGTPATLSRIHGTGDSLHVLTGSGVASAAAVLATAAAELSESTMEQG